MPRIPFLQLRLSDGRPLRQGFAVTSTLGDVTAWARENGERGDFYLVQVCSKKAQMRWSLCTRVNTPRRLDDCRNNCMRSPFRTGHLRPQIRVFNSPSWVGSQADSDAVSC